MKINVATLVALASIFMAGGQTQSVAAQQQTEETQEWTEKYDAGFLKRHPMLGETPENLQAFQQDLQPFQLHSLRGKPTVLVFGCLT